MVFLPYNKTGVIILKIKYNIIAFLVIGVLGTISHFLYEWTNYNKIVGYFSAVNESTFEHLKLLFFPTILFSLIEYFFVKKEIKNYISSVIISVIIGIISIVVLFYTYKGVLGYNVDAVNIAIYYISIIIMLIVKNRIIDSENFSTKSANIFFLLIGVIISFIFFIFTYTTPLLGIFTPASVC